MRDFTLYDFYRALKDSVQHYPDAENKCQSLQTFRVLQYDFAGDMTSANLAATPCDKGGEYFFSKLWKKKGYPREIVFDYPLLTASRISASISNLPDNKVKKVTYEIEIGVSDKYSEDCNKGACAGCNGRTVNQIYRDTEAMLMQVIEYLKGVYIYQLDECEVAQPLHEGMIAAMLETGQISEPVQKGPLQIINKLEATGTLSLIERPADKLFGTAMVVRLAVNLPCDAVAFDFSRWERSSNLDCLTCAEC